MEKSSLHGVIYRREWAGDRDLSPLDECVLSWEVFDKVYRNILDNLREFRLEDLSVDLGSDCAYADQAVYLKENVIVRLKNRHIINLCSNDKKAFESLAEKLGLPLDISPRDFTRLSIPKLKV